MAETATKTGAPSRTRKPAAATVTKAAAKPAQKPPTAAKATTKAAAPKATEEAPPADPREKVLVPFDYAGDTKSYAVFVPPADSGCVGKAYVPLGTEEVRVLLIMAEPDGE